MATLDQASERSRLLEATHQSDANSSSQESSWQDTALRVLALVGWVLISIPLVTLCWTADHIAENWNAIWSSPEEGVGAVMHASYSSTGNENLSHVLPQHPQEKSRLADFAHDESMLHDFVDVDSEGISDSEVKLEKQRVTQAAVKNIEGGSYTEKGTVYAYIDFLESQYGEQAIFIKELVDPNPKQNILQTKIIPEVVRAIDEGKQFVFIPVEQSSPQNHIVLFALNLKNGAIEYFDPKGEAPGAAEIRALPGVTVSKFPSMLTEYLFYQVTRMIGEKENPDLVKLRDMLAQKDNDSLQETLRKEPIPGYGKLARTVSYKGPTLGYAIHGVFAHQSPSIPELKKVIAACEKTELREVRSDLCSVFCSTFSPEMQDQIKRMYSSDFDKEKLKDTAEKELGRMQKMQNALSSCVDDEIMSRGRPKNPYRNGTTNYSYGSKTPHQGLGDWTNCGRFVMHFMKMRLEQSLRPKPEQPWYSDQERLDFDAATKGVKKPKEIRLELIADLS
ncbi:hypothetical protein [Simkania negevensis]|uniref:Uncharacterized protein n=1 Tax=Simkania negevensis (strain ATCC VR-1471 / DSM 27360 / Z) TaxID=331113 RepID=F8L927_SIMNZ|nr:hypothetical protein [Simkania negevensis]CCB89342.1 unknown protein [Simkania negevensis Z]